MILRRVFFYWQFVAVGVLPLWLMIAASIYGDTAWQVLGAAFGAIAIGLGLLAVSLLVFARKEVRQAKAVSWPDVGVQTLWHVLIVLMGLYSVAAPWVSVLVVLVGIGAFWFALWELFDAARKRMREAMVYLDETAKFGTVPAGSTPNPSMTNRAPGRPDTAGTPPAEPTVFVVQEKPTEP